MARLGVLAAVLPEGADPAALAAPRRARRARRPAAAAGRPARRAIAEALADRLRLSGGRARAPRRAPHRRRCRGPTCDDAALRRLLAETRPDVLIGRTWLARHGGAGMGPRCARGSPPCRRPSSRWRAATCWRSACRPAPRSARCCGTCAHGGWRAAASRTPTRAGAELARRAARLIDAARMDATTPRSARDGARARARCWPGSGASMSAIIAAACCVVLRADR